jgi:hypothetical protein
MKTTPTFNKAGDKPTEISRLMATIRLRLERSRPQGKIHKFRSGYILSTQNCLVQCPRPPRPRRVEPPAPFSLSVLLTRKYVPGWSHLDNSHPIGNARIISSKEGRGGDWESSSQLVLIEVDTGRDHYRPHNVMRAIHDTMQQGCRCQHDCCACVQTHVSSTRHLAGNRYAAVLIHNRNV